MVKNPSVMQEMWIQSPARSPGGGNGNSLQFLAWEILWTGKPGRLQSMGLGRVGHD